MKKTWQDYLDEHDGDATKAGEAAARDVAARQGENATARAFHRTFAPILKELNIPATDDGAATLHERVDAALDTSNRVPKDGLGLTAEQKTQWEAWQALTDAAGQPLTPQAAQTELTQGRELSVTNQLREVTDASGAKLSVLQDRLRGTNLRVELREVQQDGKAVKVAHVIERGTDGKDADKGALKEYATANWPDYVPVLFPAQTQQAQGRVVNGQSGASGQPAPTGNAIQDALGRRAPSAERVVVDPFATPSTGAKP